MDLSVFHPVKSLDRDYTWKDKLNSITGTLGCRFLEWSGWYNQDISQRLLGHYRLYQLFKAKSRLDSLLSSPLAYITHYRTLQTIKYAFSCITALLYYIFTLGDRYYPLLVEQLNKQLINRHYTILQDFLIDADCSNVPQNRCYGPFRRLFFLIEKKVAKSVLGLPELSNLKIILSPKIVTVSGIKSLSFGLSRNIISSLFSLYLPLHVVSLNMVIEVI
jgi:hypothetical protein